MDRRLTVFFLCSLACFGQAMPKPVDTGGNEATFRSGAQEVLLDVVVRDKKGQRVTDLRPGDLEVYDNGVKREISSFRLIEGGSTAIVPDDKAAPSAAATPIPEEKKHVNPLGQIRLVTLIFNRLDLNSRTLAKQASVDLLKNEFPENVFMSVLVLDDGVHALQAFTNDRTLLRKAVDHATSGAYTEFISDSKRIE
jgi:VWFA-related protein